MDRQPWQDGRCDGPHLVGHLAESADARAFVRWQRFQQIGLRRFIRFKGNPGQQQTGSDEHRD
jgi:hypothetical protein